ncbi:MAG: hypothetical protein IT208_05630 [Chthonomonadales bacterium]|nr:hypothetical protein [Chthonomonadales bacterium]
MSLDELNETTLAGCDFADPQRALRILRSLAGQGVTDEDVGQLLPSLLDAVCESPDPDRALNNFERWIASVTSRYTQFRYLLAHPAALRIFFSVCGVSQFFSDILIRSPEYFEILANPGVRGGSKSAAELYGELSRFVDGIAHPDVRLDAMRRFRQREVLRIGTRDILGLADLPATAREFSNLADACVQKCYEIARAQIAERRGAVAAAPFAVIGMGKLGGAELNYSSDIDLLFVCGCEAEADGPPGPPLDVAHGLAEATVNGLSRRMNNGHLFRVDMRLRPEGRFGALVRTLSSYRAYYENWAEPWERQALIKARAIAGDPVLGEAFVRMVEPFVYRRTPAAEFLDSIRRNKQRIERKAEMEGIADTNVKVGRGGIRDIEFAVQLLQLEHGGRDPMLRTPNTLEAIARLRQVGVLSGTESAELADAYAFLRTVEHRLQILYELQTQALPTRSDERRLLARRLGYPDVVTFDADYRRRTHRVRELFERLFRPGEAPPPRGPDRLADLLTAIDSPSAREALVADLRDRGFRDPDRAVAIARGAVEGGDYGRARPEASERFVQLAGVLVAACARTGDPDAALAGLDSLAIAMPNRAELYRSLADAPDLLDRLARLAAGSPPLIVALTRRLEWLDLLVSEEVIDPAPKRSEEARRELEARLPRGHGAEPEEDEAFWSAVAGYVQRERLRIGARDTWGETSALGVCEELTAMAEAVLHALLAFATRRAAARHREAAARDTLASLALVGLGKLGGQELSYGSDWDVVLVFRGGAGSAPGVMDAGFAAATTAAETLLAAGQELRTRGAPVEIDARLRPEGRFGALARPVEDYRRHYAEGAETWERQVLTKARLVAGDVRTGAEYMATVEETLYRGPLEEERVEEIRQMKRRIEQERLKPGERDTDIKLGHGGLSDIEFTAQLWQMRVGADHPTARVTGTAPALRALGRAGALPGPDASRLAATYEEWTRLRNRLALLGDIPTEVLPDDARRLRALAVGTGAVGAAGEAAEDAFRRRFAERMRETRIVVERLFYGR